MPDLFTELLSDDEVRKAARVIASRLLAYLDEWEKKKTAESAIKPDPTPAVPTPPPPPKPVKDPDALRPTVKLVGTTSGGSGLNVEIIGPGGVRRVESRPAPAPTIIVGPKVVSQGDPLVVDRRAGILNIEAQADLSLIAQRARLKADATKFALRQRRGIAAGSNKSEFSEEYRTFITSARSLEGAHLWMIDPEIGWLPDDEGMQTLAGLFETLASAAELVQALRDMNHPGLATGMALLAECQSALRAMLLNWREDQDQRDAFRWLRTNSEPAGIYIERYMRMDDVANPEEWRTLLHKIEKHREALGAEKRLQKNRKQTLGKVKYHGDRILKGSGSDDDWKKVFAAVDALISGGTPPSNVELRDLLLPLVDRLPEIEYGHGMAAALREVQKYRDAKEEAESAKAAEHAREKNLAPEVAKVASKLHGKQVLLVGGVSRDDAKTALEDAFSLKALDWPSKGKHHESLEVFRPHVRQADLVLLMIRWSSHSYADLQQLCDEKGIPLVRLKAGYNPNQVARTIVEQAGERLGIKEAANGQVP